METFRREFGTSPSEYLKRRQIDAAVLLLTKTDLPLARVGSAAGFGSQRTLLREFQRRLGTTPARVRSERENVSNSKSGR
jgi:transcriptional regulator GlxA family with amidase domain